ncbi:MAG: hypothetical protein EZS28_006909 [Streblomastix strix]|uniref:Uncharacterized protein n=1 Tax=Streblomastix strix TaxID=222440 RepID=A0A5J4WR48_9EUKA|nr:MAG: hypothetical protein EZS28_006909 [Streblomastix strix]
MLYIFNSQSFCFYRLILEITLRLIQQVRVTNIPKELIGKIALDVQVALLVMKNKKREQISQKLRERGSQKEQKVDDSKRWRNMMGMSRSRRVGIENIEVNNSLLYSGFMKEEFEQGEEYGSATQQITVGYEDQEDEEEEEDEFSIESQEEKMDEDEVD